MIVVDTNIISEVMRPQPAPAVIQWLDRQETSLLYLTTILIILPLRPEISRILISVGWS